MTAWLRIEALVTHFLVRRRLHWVEISITRARSHDQPTSPT